MHGDPVALTGLLAALGAGIVSFLSPCVLPLVPGYLSAVTGVSVAELEDAGWRSVLVPSLIFVASFSAIFIVLGLTATGLGRTLNEHQGTLEKVAGVLIIALGIYFVASLFIVRLNREWHVEALMARAGKGGPLVAGAAFAIALLLAVYSAGLGIPFLVTALAFSRMTTAFAVVKRHYAVIMAGGGVILVAMGVLILTGEFTALNQQASNLDPGISP
jgi:cytochrome c-type biogenesis protein